MVVEVAMMRTYVWMGISPSRMRYRCLVLRNGGRLPGVKVKRGVAFKVVVEWGLLPWLGDAASKVMDILFGPRVSAQTLVDKWLMGETIFEGVNR